MDSGFSLKAAENFARLAVPHGLLLALLVANVVSVPLLPAAVIKPQFVLMAVYYWAIYRPTLAPPLFCFMIGLAVDTLSGMPLGVNAAVFILTQWIVKDQRKFLMVQPYFAIWAVFGVVCLAAVILQWAMHGLTGMNWAPLAPAMIGVAASMLFFPFITLLLVGAHRILPVSSRGYG